MEVEIPLFPLNLVAFPGEQLNLHIFEPRYKQLLKDCLEHQSTFGIPSYVLNKIDYGTEVEIVDVVKMYEDGRADISVQATQVFRVQEFKNPWKDRDYAGGSVTYMEMDFHEDMELKLRMLDLCQELFSWLQMEDRVPLDQDTTVFTVAHKIGLKLEEELELIKLPREVDRQHFIINHLKNILPALERAERAKERIRLNGHFKHLDPLKF